MDIQHCDGHTALRWTYSTTMDMQHCDGRATLRWACNIAWACSNVAMDIQPGAFHAAESHQGKGERESRQPPARRFALIAMDRRARGMYMPPQRVQALIIAPRVAGAPASSRPCPGPASGRCGCLVSFPWCRVPARALLLTQPQYHRQSTAPLLSRLDE
jgi:hypothetical protein